MTELCITEDGSYTLYSDLYKEHYHSRREGALQESLYKHVIPAFAYHKDNLSLKILDICFGLGYNTFASIYYAKKEGRGRRLEILSPELDSTLLLRLRSFSYPNEFGDIGTIIAEVLKNGIFIGEEFSVKVIIGDALSIIKELDGGFDVVYQDPFSPKKNPTLWSEEYFTYLYKTVAKGGIVTTYSSARGVREAMRSAGFEVTSHTGEGFSKEGSLGFKH